MVTAFVESIQSPALQSAVSFAQAGRRVLPIYGFEQGRCQCKAGAECKRPGKHPHVWQPYRVATSDADVIDVWAVKWPNANWAWIPDDHAVLDVDYRNGGEESLYELEHLNGSLPATETVKTGDGYHYIYRVPDSANLSSAQIAPGLELKTGKSAYVMLAGSVHHSEAMYDFVAGHELGEIDVAPLPDWLSRIAPVKVSARKNFTRSVIPQLLDRNRLEDLLEPGTHLWLLWHCNPTIGGDTSPSGWDFKVCLELHRLGYTLEDAAPVIAEYRAIHGRELSKPMRPDYLARTWQAAVELPAPTGRPSVSQTLERKEGVIAAFGLRHRVLEQGGYPVHVLALEVLASYASDAVCYMAGSRLAEEVGCSRRHGNRILEWLDTQGFINRLQKGKDGKASRWELSFMKTHGG